MSDKVTLEQLEQLVAPLSPPEQIKLIACISERLSEISLSEATEERLRQDYAARIEAFLKKSEEMAAETIRVFDGRMTPDEARKAYAILDAAPVEIVDIPGVRQSQIPNHKS